jgi:hypothetical protein
MFKAILDSIVFVPVLLGMVAATTRRAPQGFKLLLVLLLAYNVFYLALMTYLRIRWLG